MKYTTLVLIQLFILQYSITARAQNSFLDSTFGNNGIATTESFIPKAIALQADGKILVGGSKLAATPDPILFRFNPDGSADATFGINGKVQLDLPHTENITDIAPLPNGQILVVGIRTVSGGGIIPTTSMIMFMRFDANGIPDTSIGDQGMVLTGFGTQLDKPNWIDPFRRSRIDHYFYWFTNN